MKGGLVAAALRRSGAAALLWSGAALAQGASPASGPGPLPPSPMPEVEILHGWSGPDGDALLAALGAAFEARTPYRWKDGGVAGEAVVVSRIIGGDPPAAVQLEHGRKAVELARGGFLLDLTELAEKGRWRERLVTPALLDACTVDGRVFCVPVTLRAGGWLTLSRPAFARAGLDVPSGWSGLMEAAEPLQAAGVAPLRIEAAPGPLTGLLAALILEAGAQDPWEAALRDGDGAGLSGPASTRAFEAFGAARDIAHAARSGGDADAIAAELSGDGSWGTLSEARRVAGGDHKCLPGLGGRGPLAVTGDAFYFPVRRDADLEAAQFALASLLSEPGMQAGISTGLGVLPARSDVDITALYACARKGLVAVATRGAVPARDLLVPLAAAMSLDDLLVAFWNDPEMSPADLQAAYVEAIAR